jgi:uncharacterized protein (DUF924 family)
MNTTWEDIIHFWFEECDSKQWFGGGPDFDELIRSRFLETHRQVVAGESAAWRTKPDGRLAEIIVLDQFSRNMFRGTPEAFLSDPIALSLAEEAVHSGDDLKLDQKKRQFLYMPYMHSESRFIHEKAIELFETLGNSEYEQAHKAITDQFGRYPHRNVILGRVSTPEEEAFIKTHKGF